MGYSEEVRKNIKCFADGGTHCKLLKSGEKDCLVCGFYKTERDLQIGRLKALRRLRSLPKSTRMAIAEKYKVEGIV